MRVSLLHDRRFAVGASIIVFALDVWASERGQRWGDWLAASFFAAYGLYCIQNFVGCREAHCAITGPGFFIAAVLMALRAAALYVDSSAIAWIVFGAAAVIGHFFEGRYESRTGTVFMPRRR